MWRRFETENEVENHNATAEACEATQNLDFFLQEANDNLAESHVKDGSEKKLSPTNDKAVEEQDNDEWTEVHEYLTQSRTKVTRTEEKEPNSSDEEERSKTVNKTDSFQLHSKDDSLFLAVSSKSALQEQCDKSEETGVYSSNTSKIMSEIDIHLEDQSKKSSNAFEGNNHSQGQATPCKTEKESLGKDGKGSPQNTT